MAPGKFLSLVTKRGLYTALRGALFWLSHDLVHVEDRNTEIAQKKCSYRKGEVYTSQTEESLRRSCWESYSQKVAMSGAKNPVATFAADGGSIYSTLWPLDKSRPYK